MLVHPGIPQKGDLATHLSYYKRDLAAIIPEIDYRGYCLLDYEFWCRACAFANQRWPCATFFRCARTGLLYATHGLGCH